jgi:hypothetical protein
MMAITTLANVKLILGITGTTQDTLITALIPLVEQQYQNIQGREFEKDEDDNIIYPIGSEITAIKMIKQNIDFKSRNGKASESLGNYSVSFLNTADYEKSITGEIRKYAIMK